MLDVISRKLFLLFLFVITAALPGILYAKTYYVAPDGDDGNPGTIEAPFATLTKAHDNEALQPGDEICLRGGTYYPTEQTVFNKEGSADNFFVLSTYPSDQWQGSGTVH